MPLALAADLAHPSRLDHSGLSNGEARPALDWSASMGWARQSYAIPAMDLRWTRVEVGVPCDYWRSVGASQNTFFFEHMIDLAARSAGVDPMAYRRRLLAQQPRALAFVDALAAAVGRDRPAVAGRYRGAASLSAADRGAGAAAAGGGGRQRRSPRRHRRGRAADDRSGHCQCTAGGQRHAGHPTAADARRLVVGLVAGADRHHEV